MTDTPRVSVFCFGKDSVSADAAAECGRKIYKFLKKSGYMSGGYKSMQILEKNNDDIAKKLSLLCLCSNLVLTVGCDGFCEEDVIPDITKKICEKDAPFFALHACGACNIKNYEKKKSAYEKSPPLPSRATAGICNSCLIINLPSDSESAMNRLGAMLPMINFALIGLCGKSARCSADINDELMSQNEKFLSEKYLYSRFQGNINI